MGAAEVNNGEPRRDFVEYDHPDGLYTLEAHKVLKDTEGTVLTAGNIPVFARVGDVLVRQGNYYEVHSGPAFDEIGLIPVREQNALEQFGAVEDEEKKFDPSEHSAAEVRRYLRNPELSEEERERVVELERNGANRSSAIPQ